jgi:hypothetical protein
LDKFREKGYLSVEDESESVSKTAEYSYDMWCVREIAGELDLKEDEKYFRKFENSWQELHNRETGFMQPRKNGNWLSPFNPYEVNNNYTEANAWQYSFYHPHQNVLTFKIDSLFIADSKTQGRTQADITGMIGQYAHGNEPSHNYIYLLEIKKRIKYLRYVYDNFYSNKPNGLIGNEDCGQMSAWYVMSALGFYQTCPGEQRFLLGLPIFEQTKLNLENTILLKNDYSFVNCKKWDTIKSKQFNVSLKDKKKLKTYADQFHSSELKFKEFDSLNILIDTISVWGYLDGPWSFAYLESPIIFNKIKTNIFRDSTLINIEHPMLNYFIKEKLLNHKKENFKYYYSINNSIFLVYRNPFNIYENSKITAYAVRYKNDTSNLSTAHFYRRPHNYSIQLNCKYNKQYTADGDDGIIDGQYGDIDWKKGGWQGYQSQDFEAVIDMKEKKQFAEISANFLQDTRSWILFPKKVEFYISDDNIHFTLAETIENKISPQDYTVQTQQLKVTTQKGNNTARYIKVKAFKYGKLPEWHSGKGDDAFIFIDEIEIK